MKNSKGRDFKRRDDRGGRGFSQRGQMFEAVCAECGKKCEVPFKPTGDKPVYCAACFEERQGSQPRRAGGRDFGRPRHRDRERKMYSAVCDKCGKKCQVPFQPTAGKPIYCDQCFGKSKPQQQKGGDQLQQINAKLDKIINALIAAKIIKPLTDSKSVKVQEKKNTAKAEPKKAIAKKSTTTSKTAPKAVKKPAVKKKAATKKKKK